MIHRVTDDTTRDEIAGLLADVCREAKRCPRIVERFTTDKPTDWSEHHELIDALLGDWLAAT